MTITFPAYSSLVPIGTKVYHPNSHSGTATEDEVTGYSAVVLQNANDLQVVPTDYRLKDANLRRGLTPEWKLEEFCLTRDEAEELAVRYSVRFTDEDWLAAIAVGPDDQRRVDDENLEYELSTCCAVISDIRDALTEVKKDGYIDGISRRTLINLLKNHEPPEQMPVLTKILAKMGIVWQDNLTVDGKPIQENE